MTQQRASLPVIVTLRFHWEKTQTFAKLFFEVGTEKSYSLSLLSSERCMEFFSVLFPSPASHMNSEKSTPGTINITKKLNVDHLKRLCV